MQQYADKDATELARMVRDGEVSPGELVEAAIASIEELNPALNVVVQRMDEHAREVAAGELPDGPFRGVPFLLKDLGASWKGLPMSRGCRFTKDQVMTFDSTLVKRYKRAGLVVVGKTNTPELGILPTTEPHLFGAAKNPYDAARSTGGSSGGSAAAVASGIVPMAHANDGGGSIRIPASCCGVFGLKPTRARVPLGPAVGDIMSGLVCDHAVTRSVRDSAALLDASAGPDLGDPYWAPPQARPYVEEVGVDPGKLRVALTLQTYNGAELHPDCIAAARSAAALCEELGHDVEEAGPDLPEDTTRAFMTVWAAGITSSLQALEQEMGRAPGEDELEPLTRALGEMGKQPSAGDYLSAIALLQFTGRRIAQFMTGYDIWLTPTLGEPPLPLGSLASTPENPLAGFMRSAQWVPFTPFCNVSGQPAMSVPLHMNGAGLPIGVHFAARFGDEATLFRLAAQLEAARPWIGRRPGVRVGA